MATFARLLGFLRPYRTAVAWSFGLAALAMVATVAIPYLTGRAVDAIRGDDSGDLRVYALLIALAGVLRLALTVGRRLIAGRMSLAVEYDLRTRVYEHLQSLELAFFDRQQTGQRSEEHTSELQSRQYLVCRLLLEKKLT